ncbi:MAG: acyl-CoA dehydrogenase family protein, partial [Solirubrobacteraceae bacterium]
IGPVLSDAAAANEAQGALTDETVKLLVETGVAHFWVPRQFGGSEATPLEGLATVEALAYADAATGWVVMAWQLATATAAAYLRAEGAESLFGDGIPLIAGSGVPSGRAEVDGSGYRLTGTWRYGSGILNSRYAHSAAFVYDGDTPRVMPGSKAREVVTLITPVEELELCGGWDGVLGLRATGSVDYRINDVLVPLERVHAHNADVALRGGELYRLGVFGMVTLLHSAWALGVGRRALDELARLARDEDLRASVIAPRAGDEAFREHFARGEGRFRAARTFVVDAQSKIETTIIAGEPMSTRQVSLARLALNHVTATVAEIGTLAYLYGGGTALRPGTLQRCFRDIFTGTQHISTASTVLHDVGRELLDLADGMRWGPIGLSGGA